MNEHCGATARSVSHHSIHSRIAAPADQMGEYRSTSTAVPGHGSRAPGLQGSRAPGL